MEIEKNTLMEYWKSYVDNGEKVVDVKGNTYTAEDFSEVRLDTIEKIKEILTDFHNGVLDIKSFKSTLDGLNKRNNHWGFTAIKGQMFFNQLVNNLESDLTKLTDIIKKTIVEPADIDDAEKKIELLESYIYPLYAKSTDKRKTPKPSSIPYFLSYFWQIADYNKWPIYYSSLIRFLKNEGLWIEQDSQRSNYKKFYEMINRIKDIITVESDRKITHWDVEHCLWEIENKENRKKQNETSVASTRKNLHTPSTKFKYVEYIPPIISDLVESGQSKDNMKVVKGMAFEKKVSLSFKVLDFIVEDFGQGRGREPDAIVTLRPENIAFIIDAKVRPEGYSIGTDDRAIKEYINKYFPLLKKDGYKKTGFLIVSTAFKGDPSKFIDEITLDTDIKRLGLLTSEALLYLIAYKLKSSVSTTDIANILLQNGIVDSQIVIEQLDDI